VALGACAVRRPFGESAFQLGPRRISSGNDRLFYVRSSNTTQNLDGEQAHRYITGNWRYVGLALDRTLLVKTSCFRAYAADGGASGGAGEELGLYWVNWEQLRGLPDHERAGERPIEV